MADSKQKSKTPQILKDFKDYLDEKGIDYSRSYQKKEDLYLLTYFYEKDDKKFRIRLCQTPKVFGIVIDGFPTIPEYRMLDAYNISNDLAIKNLECFTVKFVNRTEPTLTYEMPLKPAIELATVKNLVNIGIKHIPQINSTFELISTGIISHLKFLKNLHEYYAKLDIPSDLKKFEEEEGILTIPLENVNASINIFFNKNNLLNILIDNYGFCPKECRAKCLELINKLNQADPFTFYLYKNDIRAILLLPPDADRFMLEQRVENIVANVVKNFNDIRQQVAETVSVKVSLD